MTLDRIVAISLGGWINTLVPAMVLAGGVGLFLRAMPRLNAATRYAAWWAVLAGVLFLPFTQLRISSETAEVRRAAPVSPSSSAPAIVLPPIKAVSGEAADRFPVRIPPGRLPIVLAALWAAGTLASLLRLLLGYFDLRGIIGRARPLNAASLGHWIGRFDVRRPVRLLASDEIGSPLAAGFLRPAVLVPESLLARLSGDLAAHVVVHELVVHEILGRADGLVDVRISLRCSSGTYIRAIARDLGRQLGVGGHLVELRRTAVGPFTLSQAHTLEALAEDWSPVPLKTAARGCFPAYDLTEAEAADVRVGRSLDAPMTAMTAVFAPDGEFLALYEPRGELARPVAVFVG